MTVTLGALVLSSLVAQATPMPVATAIATQAPATSASAAPQPSDDFGVRRGPETAPHMRPPVLATDAVIRNSGSTNTAGYTIVVHPSGSADVTTDGATTSRTVGGPQVRWLFLKLRAAGPLDVLPGGHCMKSASFGSTTTVAFGGRTSPDLSCGGDAMVRELDRTANVIATQLQVGGPRLRGRMVR